MLDALSVRYVLILYRANLGDVVLFSGALRYIRQRYPKAEIKICVKRYVKNYLELCPYIDRILEWEDISAPLLSRFPFLRNVRGGVRLDLIARSLRNHHYASDILLLPVRTPKGGVYGIHEVARTIPAKQCIGISGDYGSQSQEEDEAAEDIYSSRLHLPPERYKEHEFQVTCDFLNLSGIEVSSKKLWPEFWVNSSDRDWANKHIPISGEVTLALCPGVTSLPEKFYPAEKYVHVLSALSDKHFSIVLFGGMSEKAQCDEVLQALVKCRNVVSVTNLSGRSSIREMIEGLRRCDVVLTQETAALHIATALHKPTVGIMGGGHYGRFYPWGNPAINRVTHKPMDCYWCNWKCRYSTIRCIQEISPAVISAELRAVLKNRSM